MSVRPIFLVALAMALSACGRTPEQIRSTVDTTDTRSKTLLELTSERSELTRFRLALEVTGLARQLHEPAYHTVFAPVDEGFFAGVRLDSAFAANRRDTLLKIVGMHVVRGSIENVGEDEVTVSTLADEPLTLERRGDLPRVEGRRVLGRYLARDGVLYVIPNSITLPPPDTLEASQEALLRAEET